MAHETEQKLFANPDPFFMKTNSTPSSASTFFPLSTNFHHIVVPAANQQPIIVTAYQDKNLRIITKYKKVVSNT